MTDEFDSSHIRLIRSRMYLVHRWFVVLLSSNDVETRFVQGIFPL